MQLRDCLENAVFRQTQNKVRALGNFRRRKGHIKLVDDFLWTQLCDDIGLFVEQVTVP